ETLAGPQQAAHRAQAAMQRATESAGRSDAAGAQQAGEEAEQQLAELPDALRARRDSLAGAWRQETLDALDRALAETAALAEREQQVAESLRRGDGSPTTRSRQASVEEGTAAVERQIREAAGKHALVSPQLEGALGFAQRQMAAAREQLEQGEPNTSEAAALAEQAVDALNATALALARSRGQVAGAQSGSGFAEAVELLAQQTIQRQERLYRRLLDAGRTLSGSEPDEKTERTSRPATGDSVHLPALLKPGATGAGPRLRYPTWEELSGLTPEQRRLVLEYFRRLNAPEPR